MMIEMTKRHQIGHPIIKKKSGAVSYLIEKYLSTKIKMFPFIKIVK